MRTNQTEARVLQNLFMYATGDLNSFQLPEGEVIELLEADDYSSFTPEFREWLDRQLDAICLMRGI